MRKLEINIVIGGGGNRVVALVTSYSHISFKARKSFFSRFGTESYFTLFVGRKKIMYEFQIF